MYAGKEKHTIHDQGAGWGLIAVRSNRVCGGNLQAAPFVPPDLNDGDAYRLIFVTNDETVASSTDIAVYNDFVQDEAARSSFTDGNNVTYFAIASTATVDAIDNIGASSAPIYLVNINGTLVANGTEDLFDGEILVPINTNQNRG